VEAEVEALVGSLGHKPTRLETILINQLAALVVHADRLRRQGKQTQMVEVSALACATSIA
jgi:hypothetical protein